MKGKAYWKRCLALVMAGVMALSLNFSAIAAETDAVGVSDTIENTEEEVDDNVETSCEEVSDTVENTEEEVDDNVEISCEEVREVSENYSKEIEADTVTEAIEEAITFDALEEAEKEPTIKEQIEAKLAEVEVLHEEDYTAESWSNLQTVVTAVSANLGNETLLESYGETWLNLLQQRIDALEEAEKEPTIKEQIEAKLAEVEVLHEEDYTAESWSKLITLCENVKAELAVYSDEYLEQYGTDYLTKLESVFAQLELALDVEAYIESLFSGDAEIDEDICFDFGSNTNGTWYASFRYPMAHAKNDENGIYVTYQLDMEALESVAGKWWKKAHDIRLYDSADEEIILDSDGKFTYCYTSKEECISGKSIKASFQYTGARYVDGERVEYEASTTTMCKLIPNFTNKPVTLTNVDTGISLLTTTEYCSEDAVLHVSKIMDGEEAWENMEAHVGTAYENASMFTFWVEDRGKTINAFSDYSATLVVTVDDEIDKGNLNFFWNKYGNGAYDYNWPIEYCSVKNGVLTYRNDSVSGNYAIYSNKKVEVDAMLLADGVYEVPITTFNESDPTANSMSAQALGDTATLVVKDGTIRIELDFQPVYLTNLDGYLIQMWTYDENDAPQEIMYTEYYMNSDGTFFTDLLNKGTINYYPKSGYFYVPTKDAQFMTKFRVSAMDALLKDGGDATRDAIFTIYYGEATMLSEDVTDEPIQTALNVELMVAESVDAMEYTNDSYHAMDEAYKVAKAWYNNSSATIKDMSNAHSNLRNAIDNLVPSIVDTTRLAELIATAKNYEEDEYTSETYSTLIAAINHAEVVLADEASTQVEIDAAVEALQVAMDGLITKDSISLDASNLADGTYTVQIEMRTATDDGISMANGAIRQKATLIVKDGKGKLYVDFAPMEVSGEYGSLLKYWIYSESTPDASRSAMLNYSAENNDLTEVEYVSYHEVGTEGTTTQISGIPSQMPATDNKVRAAQICISLPYMGEQNQYDRIYSRVSVDMMDMLGVGEQNVMLKINYNTLEVVDAQATLKLDVEEVLLIAGMDDYNTITITPTLQNANGYTVTWTSDREDVATVKDGVITAVAGGEAVITCTATNGNVTLSKTVQVIVTGNEDGTAQPVCAGDMTVSGTTATVSITGNALTTIATNKTTVDEKEVIFDLTSQDMDIIDVKVSIAADTVDSFVDRAVTVTTNIGNVELDSALVTQMSKQDKEITLNIRKAMNPDSNIYEAAYELSLRAAGTAVVFGEGTATISVPCTNETIGYAYYMVDNKIKERVAVIVENGYAVWTTDHFSLWALSTRELAVNTEEIKEKEFFLADGNYYVDIHLWKSSSNEKSMGDVAFAKNRQALVKVKNGKVTSVQVATNPVNVGTYHSAITSFGVSGSSVTVLSTGPLTTRPAGNSYSYIRAIRFKMPDSGQPVSSNETTYVSVTFYVPDTPMDAAVGKVLSARLKFDWSTASATSAQSIKANGSSVSDSVAVYLKDTETGIAIKTNSNYLSTNAGLHVAMLESGTEYDIASVAMTGIKGWSLYKIQTMVNGAEVSPKGAVTLEIPCIGEEMVVYRINQNGTKTLLNGEWKNGYYYINTSTLGLFALINPNAVEEIETVVETETIEEETQTLNEEVIVEGDIVEDSKEETTEVAEEEASVVETTEALEESEEKKVVIDDADAPLATMAEAGTTQNVGPWILLVAVALCGIAVLGAVFYMRKQNE